MITVSPRLMAKSMPQLPWHQHYAHQNSPDLIHMQILSTDLRTNCLKEIVVEFDKRSIKAFLVVA